MARTEFIDCYATLGVTAEATTKDINSAYKRLALKFHPDKTGEGVSHDEFQKIQQAVEILRDPNLRNKHDSEIALRMPRREPDFPPGYTGWRSQGARRYAPYMGNRYMFSYGNSVHMDPTSSESHAERARCEELRRQAASYGGRNPFAQDFVPGWMHRKETMEERVERGDDREEVVDDGRFFTGETGFHQFSRPYWQQQQQTCAQPMEPVVEEQHGVHGQQSQAMPMDEGQQHPFGQFAENLKGDEHVYVNQERDTPMSPESYMPAEQVGDDDEDDDHAYMKQDPDTPMNPENYMPADEQVADNQEGDDHVYMKQDPDTRVDPVARQFAAYMQQHADNVFQASRESEYAQEVDILESVGQHASMQQHSALMNPTGDRHYVYPQPGHQNDNGYMHQGFGIDMNMDSDHQAYAESVATSVDNEEPALMQQEGVWVPTEHGNVYAWAQSVADADIQDNLQNVQQHEFIAQSIEMDDDLLDLSASINSDDRPPGIVQSVEDVYEDDESDDQRSESNTDGPEDDDEGDQEDQEGEEYLMDLAETEYGTANQSEGLYSDSLGDNRSGYVRANQPVTDSEEDTDGASFYDVKSTQSTTAGADHLIPRMLLTELEAKPELNALIPLFEEKLYHPSGRYTIDDLNIELKGIVYETYCGWLEGIRLTVSGAQPLTTGNNPRTCLHLGYWLKDIYCPECEVCHRWRPLYMLTCPGCGIRKCVECKFANWVDVTRGMA